MQRGRVPRVSPTMKHLAFRVLICLFVGAAATVAVAWLCAWFVDEEAGETHRNVGLMSADEIASLQLASEELEHGWMIVVRTNTGAARARLYRTVEIPPSGDERAFWLNWGRFRGATPVDLVSQLYHVDDARGWPLLAMWCSIDESLGSAEGGIALEPRATANRYVPQYRALPLRLIYRGFAVNTLLFGAVGFALLTSAGIARRRARVHRGRCPACGFDLRSDFAAGCSECGWLRGER